MVDIDKASCQLLSHLRKLAGHSGLLSYKQLIHEVLFAPQMGYYMQNRQRVGRDPGTDFYTAESLGSVFRKMLLTSIIEILGQQESKDSMFIEIGAEKDQGIFKEGNHPFAEFKSIRVGESIEIPKNKNYTIIFANELLDVQAFNRLIYKNGQWHELGVRISAEGDLSEEILAGLSSEVQAVLEKLPKDVIDGYRLDLPLEAENLIYTIVKQDWKGLLIFFDYGLSWDDLIYHYPQGTARAYYRHRQHNDLLVNIGQQDITCHICWDPLRKIMESHGFERPKLERQESFFVHHASSAIEEIINEVDSKFNYDKQTLQELLHPAHMGHKFQVLWGRR